MKRVVSILFMLLGIACNPTVILDCGVSELVVEGWIEDNGFPVVILTETLPITGDDQDLTDIKEYIVKWAKVVVTTETDTVILTGKYNEGYLPSYIYTTTNLRGKVGESYKLTVEYNDYYAVAETTIPEKPDVERFDIIRCDDRDSLFSAEVLLHKSSVKRDYYQLFSHVGENWRQYFASFMGSIDGCEMENSEKRSIYRGRHLQGGEYIPYFRYNDTISLKVAAVDSVAYLFWNDYVKTQSGSLNTFFSVSSNLHSNISGGVGYWSGYASETVYLVVKSDTTIYPSR